MKKTIFSAFAFALLLTGCDLQDNVAKLQTAVYEKIVAVLAQRANTQPTETAPTPVLPDETSPAEQLAAQEQEQVMLTEKQPLEISTQPLSQPVATRAMAPRKNPVQAVLFTHADSPLCQKLKADQWDTQFKQRYQGQVRLIEYDMKNPASREPLQAQMRKRKLSSISVPVLFIGNSILPGYPFNGEDDAVAQELATQPVAQAKRARRPARPKQSEQFMEIIMEDIQKTTVKNTKASPRDSRAMQLALASVEKNNQETLVDMGSLFGEDTKAQAYVIISRTERLLRNKASSSPDFKTYLNTQKALLQLQEKELNQLMQQNARNIRSIRG